MQVIHLEVHCDVGKFEPSLNICRLYFLKQCSTIKILQWLLNNAGFLSSNAHSWNHNFSSVCQSCDCSHCFPDESSFHCNECVFWWNEHVLHGHLWHCSKYWFCIYSTQSELPSNKHGSNTDSKISTLYTFISSCFIRVLLEITLCKKGSHFSDPKHYINKWE